MRWNLSSQKLSTKNQQLWVSSSYNTQTENVGILLKFLQKILWHRQVWRTWNGYLLPSIGLVRENFGGRFSENEMNGIIYVLKTALITLLRLKPTIFSPELAVIPTKIMIRQNWDYLKKRLDVQECCACVAKPIVAKIERVTSTNSVARDTIKEF